MYCPDCGSQNSEDQRFCRSCGLGLEKIAQSLAEQRPTIVNPSVRQQKERLERLGLAALSVFGLTLLSLFLYAITSKILVTKGPFWAVVISLAVLVVVGCGLGAVILFSKASELNELSAGRGGGDRKEIASGRGTNELLPEANDQPAFSVTDRTTELLTVDRKRQAE